MGYLKPTPSRDGKPRVDVRITYRVGRDELIISCAYLLSSGKRVSKWNIFENLKRLMYEDGAVITNTEPCNYVNDDSLLPKAEELVDRHFPEFRFTEPEHPGV